ncbi:hypothetical protein JOC75_002845 [Metabacillus crassostreae]|uniref:DUF5344 family protein n=1 Tax=Metabacillus crassostreae TaxID=929098 RepID=UPI00195C438C|nr:DUF5344 family protein [Metabacillus crassostreae]MBM7604841.1 hypothetical protein [Metabacillus crassostreae]
MPELKLNKTDVEPVFQDLRVKVQALDTSKINSQMTESKLNLINKLKVIDEDYEQSLTAYKQVLIQIEKDAWSSLESLFETDQQLAKNMK